MEQEDAVLKKVQEQESMLSLMQAQLEFQNETISKHDGALQDLLSKVQDLTSKVKELEETANKRAESVDAERTALWSSKGTTESKSSIADMAKETAEQALGVESGFVYDESLSLYFDKASGYYYDPVKQLYYNGHTQTYYTYDATTNSYQVSNNEAVKRKKNNRPKKMSKQTKAVKLVSPKANETEKELKDVDSCSPIFEDRRSSSDPATPPRTGSDVEEGELTSSNPTSAESSPRSVYNESCEEEESVSENGGQEEFYPPCVRAVIQEASDSSILKKGTLFLIPCTGGTIGSNGSHHAVLLPTSSVDKTHAKIHFENSTEKTDGETGNGKYYITDLGSRHGTHLNRTRLSESGAQSKPHELVHGSTLQVGDVILLLHIHPGDLTCGHCEPGLILQKDPMYEYTGQTSEKTRRSELKKIKKKYGLDRKNQSKTETDSKNTYTDRAKTRRLKVGSDNPFAKTEVASAEKPIQETNKGFKMLQKMGWKGEGLGNPQNTGIKEPIKSEGNFDRGGLGMHSLDHLPLPVQTSKASKRRTEELAKTLERFKQASTATDAPEPMKD